MHIGATSQPTSAWHPRCRAQEWVPPRAKHLATCRIRVVAVGKRAAIRLQDEHAGELFAEAPIREPLDRYVEPVADSSRYFVLRIDDGQGKHAFIGLGFRDRSESYDFNATLQDHWKGIARQREADAIRAEMEARRAPGTRFRRVSGRALRLRAH